jgi:uncharacterized protein YkwD
MRNMFILALAALLLTGCATVSTVKQSVGLSAPAPGAVYVPPPPPPDPKTQMAELETRLSVLVDDARHRLNPKARPLTLDSELVKIARARAADMAEKNYLAHAAPNGDTSASLLMEADAQYQGLLGENLAAQHYVKQSGVDPKGFAQRFLDTWMASPAHRDNMAFADYDRTGVGAAVNGDTVYVAILFSTTTKAGGSGKVATFDSPGQAEATPAVPAPAPLRGAAQ